MLEGELPTHCSAALSSEVTVSSCARHGCKSELTGEHRRQQGMKTAKEVILFGILGFALFWFLKHYVSHSIFCTLLFCATFHPRDLRALYSHY